MRTTPDDTVTPGPTSPSAPGPVPARSSRRALLRGGGAGLLATAVALGSARGASAAPATAPAAPPLP
ncbi:hypothetical protein MHY85_18545, partial [Cellulomonas sp. ACRRI]